MESSGTVRELAAQSITSTTAAKCTSAAGFVQLVLQGREVRILLGKADIPSAIGL